MSECPDPNLIQMYCDGECSAEQCSQVERQLAERPQLRQQVEQQKQFDAALRDRLAKAMPAAPAPSELLDQVRASLDQSAEAPAIAGRIEPAAAASDSTRRTGRNRLAEIFDDPRRGNVFAIAATLAIVAGAVLYGIFGRSIDDVRPPRPTDVFAQAALFAETEHGQCAGNEKTLQKKIQFTKESAAEKDLSQWLDAPVQIANLSSLGYEFVGAGHCTVPTMVHSGHIMYRKTTSQSGRWPMVSVFVFPNHGQCGGKLCQGMDCNCWYDCANGQCTHRVLRSTDGRLVYLLVCCADGDIDGVASVISDTLHHTGTH